MSSIKNLDLGLKYTGQTSERTIIQKNKKRLRLCVLIDRRYKANYHPLKQKIVNTQKLKFTDKLKRKGIDEASLGSFDFSEKIYKNPLESERKIIGWMISIGIKIKKISAEEYLVKNQVKTLSGVLLIANKKRVDMGLKPFIIEKVIKNWLP